MTGHGTDTINPLHMTQIRHRVCIAAAEASASRDHVEDC